MKKQIVFIFIACLFIVIGCKKEEENTNKISDGLYQGTFQRELVWADSEISNISITFSSNEWNGSSDNYKYPALCRGTYSIIGDTITFNNHCVWTAEFDWSLILSGKYAIATNGNSIEITRDYRSATSDTYIDKYVLHKQD